MIYILSGPPCSGKSTYSKKYLKGVPRVNKDSLREMLGFKGYNYYDEQLVHKLTLQAIETLKNVGVVVDNTHTKFKDFLDYQKYPEVTVIIFKTPYWKQRVRNLFRYLRTGFWIPVKVSKKMNRNSAILEKQLELLPSDWKIITINT